MSFHPYIGAQQPRAFALNLLATDPERRIDALLWSLVRPDGAVLLDIGAGSGHLACRYAQRAAHVFALEPDAAMRRQIHQALSADGAPENVSVLAASAESVPLAAGSVDIVHARFAYFFGTDACLPGLREAERVLKPGGSILVIEGSNLGEMGAINRVLNPAWFSDQSPILAFWERHGFAHHLVETVWRAPDRETMRIALEMEHGPDGTRRIMDHHPSCELTYLLRVFHRRAPSRASAR
jgi:ubiquinone/menaquinone biosynthesis C-methylase UbiE